MSDKDSVAKYFSTYNGKDLLKNYRLEQIGVWEVRGEDPNCDFGGHHHMPYIGTYSGRLEDVVELAVDMPQFWTWGYGGEIKEISIKKVEHGAAIKRKKLVEELAKKEQELAVLKSKLEQLQ